MRTPITEEWRPHLIGTAQPIRVLMDHKNLEYFATKRQLNQQQVLWLGFMVQFAWYAKYRPAKLGGKPDAWTHRSGDFPKEGDERLAQRMQMLLKPENYNTKSHAKSHSENHAENHAEIHAENHRQSPDYDTIRAAELALLAGKPSPSSPPAPRSPSPPSPPPSSSLPTDFESLLSVAYASDPCPNEVLELLRTGMCHCKTISLAECSETTGHLRYRSKLLVYIPASDDLRLHVLR